MPRRLSLTRSEGPQALALSLVSRKNPGAFFCVETGSAVLGNWAGWDVFFAQVKVLLSDPSGTESAARNLPRQIFFHRRRRHFPPPVSIFFGECGCRSARTGFCPSVHRYRNVVAGGGQRGNAVDESLPMTLSSCLFPFPPPAPLRSDAAVRV